MWSFFHLGQLYLYWKFNFLLHVSTLSRHLQASAVMKTEKHEKRAVPHVREIPSIFVVYTYILKLNVFQVSVRFKLSV